MIHDQSAKGDCDLNPYNTRLTEFREGIYK